MTPAAAKIHIDVSTQTLRVSRADTLLFETTIATANKGVGEENGSECTPRGWHVVRAKIGANQPINTVFRGRRPTGEFYNPQLRQQFPERDWILTRILWLSGLEPGFNRLYAVDTMRRYIYIHGCPDDDVMGMPSSHGCIKMKNQDIVRLYDVTAVGTRVLISA
ncbi:MAG: L,D-transpeptidase [Gammaproteobacteria bacterium]|nr:L,D-transpeptidase [Gammaproteobacteria bacterium]